jgi:fibronectin-binding autotransporter adhesin
MKSKYILPASSRHGAFALLLATSSLIAPTMAQTVIDWKANAATTAWATGSNWVGESAPANDLTGSIAQFNQSAYTSQPSYGTTSVAGIIVGNGSTAVGNLTLTGTQLNIGASGIDIKAQSGTVTLNNAVRLGASQTWTNNSGSLFTVGATISNVGNVTPFTLTIDGTGNTTTTGTITNGGATGTTAIIKNGSGILTLSNTGANTNTFTGGLTINAGTVRFGTASNGATNQLGSGNVTIGGSSNTVIDYIGANNTLSQVTSWTLQGTGTVTRSNSSGGGIGWGSAKITGSSGGLIYTAGSAGAVIQLNAVTSDYTGGTTLTSGTIVMNGGTDTTTTGTFGNASVASNVVTFNGATVRNGSSNSRTIYNNISFATDTTHATGGLNNGNLTWAGEVTLNGTGARTLTQSSATQDWVFSNAIKNGTVSSLTVNITGSRAVTLSGANTFSGTLLATGTGGGALALGNVNAVQNATLDTGSATASRAVTFTASGTNTYNIGALQGSDDLDIGANTLSVGAKAADTTFAGAISGTGGLTKVGSNKLTLSGTNSYSGNTSVQGGELIVNGAIAASTTTTIGNGATISGSGSVGHLTVNSGGSVNPGNSPGTLTVNGNYNQAGTLVAEITGLAAGTQHDQLIVNGTVSLSGSLTTQFTAGSYQLDDMIFLILNDSNDAITGTFSGLAQNGLVTSYGGWDWVISYNANSATNSFTGGNDVALRAIPETSVSLLGGLSALTLLRRRRK